MGRSPLRDLDLSRCSFLLLTSAGEAFNSGEILDMVEGDPTMGTDLVVQPAVGRANHRFVPEDMGIYHGRALANAEILIEFLLRNGVGPEAIQHVDFSNQNAGDPEKTLRLFLESLPAERPDAVIYFAGHTTRNGQWFFGWRQGRSACATVLTPGDFDINIAGERYIVADAPGTAALWLTPSLRVRGIAAWTCELCPMADIAGSPLTHWLCEKKGVEMPKDARMVEPAQEAGLRRLPCYEPLFWGAALPEADLLTQSLWQLESFTLTGFQESRDAANTEFLLRGGPLIVLKVFDSYSMDDSVHRKVGQTGIKLDSVCLSCIRLLRSLVDHAPRQRWFGCADSTLITVLQMLERRPLSAIDAKLLTEVLGLTSAFSQSFASCQRICAEQHWSLLAPLVSTAISGKKGEQCLRAGCALIARLATHPVFERFLSAGIGRRGAGVETKQKGRYSTADAAAATAAMSMSKRLEDSEGGKLLNQLISQVGSGGATSAAASEALVFAVLNRDGLKRRVLSGLNRVGAFKVLENEQSANVCGQLLALLRAVGMIDFQVGVTVDVPAKAVSGMILCMCRFPRDAEIQRWGLATLGAFASGFEDLRKTVAEGGPTCILWALGAKDFVHNEAVHQEAIYCAHVMLRGEGGHAVFGDNIADLSRLSAMAADRSLRNKGEGGSEVVLWATRVLEQICYAPSGFWKVIAHAPMVARALLHPSCTMGTINSGVAIISSLAVRYDQWKEQLKPDGEKVSRMLQLRAWKVKALGTDAAREEEVALRSWCQVINDAISDPDEDDNQADAEEEEEQQVSRRPSKMSVVVEEAQAEDAQPATVNA